MKLTWFGTAGFQIKTDQFTILIDPYFTRNPQATPKQPRQTTDINQADLIFISHGHFDHIYDVPEIASQTKAKVYCGEGIDTSLTNMGLNTDQIQVVNSDGQRFNFNGLDAQAFFSKHVVFDKWLLMRTLLRINFRIRRYLPLMHDYPEGQVLSWRFIAEDKVIHHFGSAGSSCEELERLAQKPTDILLVPMQGHTFIARIAHQYVKFLQPKMVIPHHQDDFYPPVSMQISTEKLEHLVRQSHPDTEFRILGMNQTIIL